MVSQRVAALLTGFILICQSAAFASLTATEDDDNILVRAMKAELDRSMTKLKNAGDAPLYFLGYRVVDSDGFSVSGEYGAITDPPWQTRTRYLDLDMRVGSLQCDNTHKLREDSSGGNFSYATSCVLPLQNDEDAIRAELWLSTDRLFRKVQQSYAKVKANRDVKVEEEDNSDDFSLEKSQVYSEPPVAFEPGGDSEIWEKRVKKLSAIFKDYPNIHNSSVTFSASRLKRYIANSEGTLIKDSTLEYRVFSTAEAIADDGMRVFLYDGVEGTTLADLPDEAKLEDMVKNLAETIVKIRQAPPAEPYAGPAILKARSAGVFFHEIFGHRIEGHRQKDEEEGRTFAKKVGQRIMPSFISVIDDPTLKRLGAKPLNGFYKYDDEGVPAQRVVLVDNGTLRNFLMARSPVFGFSSSNGHGRCSIGHAPCARQGNLIVQSSSGVPFAELRRQLIEEVKRQGKPYGLIFDEVAGGFTMTQTFMPQVFKLMPLKVTRVYADGRPDELVRGVDLVGTPLASLECIMSASNDTDTFNGTCGAESGWVPVSASAPSLLVKTIEVERSYKDQDKPPILPDPSIDGFPRGKSVPRGPR